MTLLSKPVPLISSEQRNDCGPCVTAMVLSFFSEQSIAPQQTAAALRFWRLPGLGATLPCGIIRILRQQGLETHGGFFGRLQDIKDHIDADHPVIVLVRPTDLEKAAFFSLHYRVVVGYNDNKEVPGGGKLFFNCSARTVIRIENGCAGNLSLSYAEFRRQWLTWASVNWYVAASPRKAGLE